MLNPLTSRRTRKRQARSLVLLALFMALVLGGGLWLAAHRRAMLLARAGLSIPPEQLDLGEVPARSDFRWKLSFFNSSDREIQVEQLLASCRCTAVEPRSFAVPPGRFTEVVVTLNLLGQVTLTSPDPEPFHADIVALVSSTIGQPEPWRMSATVVKPLVLSVAEVHFGPVAPDRAEEASKKVHIWSGERLRTVKVETGSDVLACTVLAPSNPERKGGMVNQFELCVRVRADASSGPFQCPVRLQGVGENGSIVGTITLPVTGTVVHDVRAFPDTMRVGMRKPGERVVSELTLQSDQQRQFEVVEISVTGVAGAELQECQPETKSARRFTFRYDCRRPGMDKGELRFRVRFGDGREETITVPFSVYVVDNSDVQHLDR